MTVCVGFELKDCDGYVLFFRSFLGHECRMNFVGQRSRIGEASRTRFLRFPVVES